jgi:amino acid transporter
MTPTKHTTSPKEVTASPDLNETGNGLAITSLVLGILSLTGFFIFTGVPAIITGVLSLRKKQKERGMSIAGIVMGSVSTLLSLLFILVLTAIIALGVTSEPSGMQGGEPSFNIDMPVDSSRT